MLKIQVFKVCDFEYSFSGAALHRDWDALVQFIKRCPSKRPDNFIESDSSEWRGGCIRRVDLRTLVNSFIRTSVSLCHLTAQSFRPISIFSPDINFSSRYLKRCSRGLKYNWLAQGTLPPATCPTQECYSRYRILWLPWDMAKIVTISNKNTIKSHKVVVTISDTYCISLLHCRTNLLLGLGMGWLVVGAPSMYIGLAYLYFKKGHIWSRILNAHLKTDEGKHGSNMCTEQFKICRYLWKNRVFH